MSKSERIIVERKSRKNFMTFFFALYMSALSIFGVTIIKEVSNFFAIIGGVILLTVGVYGLRLLIWLMFGKEKIILNDSELKLVKSGSFLIPTKIIPIEQIEGFYLSYSYIEQEQGFEGTKGRVTKLYSNMPYLKILDKGRIGIKYNKKRYRALNGLTPQQGGVILRELNDSIGLGR